LTICLDFFWEPHLLVRTSSLIFSEAMVKSQYTQPALSCQFFLWKRANCTTSIFPHLDVNLIEGKSL
jgi:hypothetical protein